MYILPCNFFLFFLNSAFLSTLFLNGFRAHRWSFCRNFSVIIWWIDFIHSHGNNLPWKWSYLLARWTTHFRVWNHKACLPFQHQTRNNDQTRKMPINLKYWSLKTRFSNKHQGIVLLWGFYSLNILKAKNPRKSLTFWFYWTNKPEGKCFLYTEVFLSVKKDQYSFFSSSRNCVLRSYCVTVSEDAVESAEIRYALLTLVCLVGNVCSPQ